MAAPTAPPPPAYRKLTRMRRGVGTMSQLWLGGDHLLQVLSTGYTETYRRFYLRDIQSMLIVHTARRTYYAVALVVLMLITVLIMSSVPSGPLGYAIMAGIFLPFFIWNHVRGAGCRVVVVTAVQQENVPALCRLPRTRQVLRELQPLILAAQAGLGAVAPAPAAGDGPPVLTGTTPPLPPPLPPPLAPS